MNRLFFENILTGTLLFGRFELVRCLSAGLIGGVYLCKNKADHDSLIALKIFSTQALRDRKLSENFDREVSMSFRLNHPHVVKCHDFFFDEDFTAFTMDYVDGGTLGDVIHYSQPLSVERIQIILEQLASGIYAIHQQGVVHRDLKPENILITSEGTVKITDFGIAATLGGTDSTSEQEIQGTINYLSPEYIAHGHFDERSDIYAFGVIAYELMTGRVPFSGECLIDTLISRVRFDPESPRLTRLDIPRALSDMALKSMKRDPLKRYQSITEIISHLGLIRSTRSAVLSNSVVRSISEMRAQIQPLPKLPTKVAA